MSNQKNHKPIWKLGNELKRVYRPLCKFYQGPEHNDYYTIGGFLDAAVALMTKAQRKHWVKLCTKLENFKNQATGAHWTDAEFIESELRKERQRGLAKKRGA